MIPQMVCNLSKYLKLVLLIFSLFLENIMWLTVDNIQEKESAEISEPSEVPNLVGSGVSVGAVVSDTVGASCSRQVSRNIFTNYIAFCLNKWILTFYSCKTNTLMVMSIDIEIIKYEIG